MLSHNFARYEMGSDTFDFDACYIITTACANAKAID
jgi:hypothetical protein